MQKPKSGPAANKYLFLFLALPRTRTNVNDLFIQPYTSNRKGMHWNRLKQLVCLPHEVLEFGRMVTPIRKMSFRNPAFRQNSGFPNFCLLLRFFGGCPVSAMFFSSAIFIGLGFGYLDSKQLFLFQNEYKTLGQNLPVLNF